MTSVQFSQKSSGPHPTYSNVKQNHTAISTIYQRMLNDLMRSTNYKQTLASFDSPELYSTLSLKDRIDHRIFMMYYRSKEEYTDKEKASLRLHLTLLADIPLFLRPANLVKAPALTVEKTSSGRVIRRKPEYVEYMNSKDAKETEVRAQKKQKKRKFEPVSGANPQIESTFLPPLQDPDDFEDFLNEDFFNEDFNRAEEAGTNTPPMRYLSPEPPTSGIKSYIEDAESPQTRASALKELNVHKGLFDP